MQVCGKVTRRMGVGIGEGGRGYYRAKDAHAFLTGGEICVMFPIV